MTDEPDDWRKHDGTSLRRCSHNVPFEEPCEQCVEEALVVERLRKEGLL